MRRPAWTGYRLDRFIGPCSRRVDDVKNVLSKAGYRACYRCIFHPNLGGKDGFFTLYARSSAQNPVRAVEASSSCR